MTAGLGHHDLGGALPDLGDGDQPGDQRSMRRGPLGDQGVQLGDFGGEVVVGLQVQSARLEMGGGERPSPAIASSSALRRSRSNASLAAIR